MYYIQWEQHVYTCHGNVYKWKSESLVLNFTCADPPFGFRMEHYICVYLGFLQAFFGSPLFLFWPFLPRSFAQIFMSVVKWYCRHNGAVVYTSLLLFLL